MTGAGKTTFVNRYLLHAPTPAGRFLFDDLNRSWPRLNLPPCFTERQLEDSLASRWTVFQPVKMFPGDTRAALRWFCSWVLHVAERGPGRKLVCIPEVWRHCSEDSIPVELALLAQTGRELDVELVLDTQRPELVNPSITGAATELVLFRLMAREAIRAAGKLWADSAALAPYPDLPALPLGTFRALNRLSGQTLAGRLF